MGIAVPLKRAVGGLQLADANGTSKFEIKDNDGFVVFSVDSEGNIRHRGKIGRQT